MPHQSKRARLARKLPLCIAFLASPAKASNKANSMSTLYNAQCGQPVAEPALETDCHRRADGFGKKRTGAFRSRSLCRRNRELRLRPDLPVLRYRVGEGAGERARGDSASSH